MSLQTVLTVKSVADKIEFNLETRCWTQQTCTKTLTSTLVEQIYYIKMCVFSHKNYILVDFFLHMQISKQDVAATW